MRIGLLTSALLLLLTSCSSDEELIVADPLPEKREAPKPSLAFAGRRSYPWDGERQPITIGHFRCKGSKAHSPKGELTDCDGMYGHSLPLRGGKEFIYPALLQLLNEIGGEEVIITTGHRCIKHHLYAKIPGQSRTSKHMLGAEVAFYIRGLENNPEEVVRRIQRYYQKHFPEEKEYTTWQRYQKSDTDVTTQPIYNKEAFIKVYKPLEGRDLDNQHPYPYIRIQLRYDHILNEKVLFSWGIAEKNIYKHSHL